MVATYTYIAGLLAEACGLDPDSTGPNQRQCVTYTYDTTGSFPKIATVASSGLTPWRYSYDTNNRVTGVKRAQTTGGGDAAWAIDYSMSLTAAGAPDMSATAAAQWGQTIVPTGVAAVYAPQADGGASMGDPTKGQLFYTRPDGEVTNTATYGTSGWLVNTTWNDEHGNTVRGLDGAGWAQVQAAPAAERLAVAEYYSSYTQYNTKGTRAEFAYGPATTATLANGETGAFRAFSEFIYDDEATTLGGPKPANPPVSYNLVVKQRTGTTNANRDGTEYDVTTTLFEYDPVVTGDGNGWELGTPTRTKQQEGTGWATTINRYTEDGVLTETRRPGGVANAAGAGTDARTSRYTYYTAGTHPTDTDCGNKPVWEDMACKVIPGGQPSGPPIPTTWNKTYGPDLQPTVVEEKSGTTTRTATSTYDLLGRPTGTSMIITGGNPGDQPVPATTTAYDNTTGQPTTVTAGGKTVTTGYDGWGRATGYTDAAGNHSATTFTPAGNVNTHNDGAGNYTYQYDTKGLLTGVNLGAGVGSFGYTYTNTGQVNKVTYPNGLEANYDHNETGATTALTYSQAGIELLAFTARVDVNGRTLSQTSPGGQQDFTFDDLGRLTKTTDTRDATGCSTRTYGFDTASNRTTSGVYAAATDSTCQSTTATTSKTNAYDAAGRIRNTGYAYDNLGRTLTTPLADTTGGLGALTTTYHADDMVASLSQSIPGAGGTPTTSAKAYTVDPEGRIDSITHTVGGAETQRQKLRFGDNTDMPTTSATSTDAGATWATSRNLRLPELGMVGSITGSNVEWSLQNLHGDTVASLTNTAGTTTISSYSETDEYGINLVGQARNYGYLGTEQRSTDTIGGLTLMGARLYNPTTGLFGSVDSIPDANETMYTYPQDPINSSDPTGQHPEIDLDWTWVRSETVAYSLVQDALNGRWGGCSIPPRCYFTKSGVRIPVPNPRSMKALNDFQHYVVYEIYRRYAAPLVYSTWKYGITSRWPDRPKRQLRKCNAYYKKGECSYKHKRSATGFLEARKWETALILRYVARFGECPPGQSRSCR